MTESGRGLITICVFCAFGEAEFPGFEKQLLEAFLRSIRRVYGNSAKVILLTDTELRVEPFRDLFAEIRVFRVDRTRLLLARAEAYLHVIDNHDWSTPLALLDYDVLVLRPVSDIFDGYDDVFVTDRPYSKAMPINGGVIFLNNKAPKNSSGFYKSVVNIYRALPREQLAWWGDQVALSRAVFADATAVADRCVAAPTWRVRLLPREAYNYTPYDVDSGTIIPRALSDDVLGWMRSGVCIAHFKGARKHLMLELEHRLGFDTEK